jgi:hypothetical protein
MMRLAGGGGVGAYGRPAEVSGGEVGLTLASQGRGADYIPL